MKTEFLKIPERLSNFARLGPVYLVGGSLRDRILKRPSYDHDFAVPGDARAFARKIAVKLGVFEIALGKGDHAVFRVVSGNCLYDFSPLQGETIEEDLKRRDFTINALGLDLGTGRLIDPTGGTADIRAKKIRLISEDAFRADPLRMVRAFRIGAVLGFRIVPETLSAVKEHLPLVSRAAAERIKSELFRMMGAEDSFSYLDQMSESGLLTELIPELGPCSGCPAGQNGQSLLHHLLATYKEMEILLKAPQILWPPYIKPVCAYLEPAHRKVLLKWAALLHDLGKPQTRSIDTTGRLRFLAHEEKGALLVNNVCSRLRMSGAERSYLELIVANHLHPLHLFDAHQRNQLTTRGLVRFVRKYRDDLVGLLLHSVADQRGKTGHIPQLEKEFLAFLEGILRRYFSDFKPAMATARLVTGKDLIEHFELSPSKLIGRLLRAVDEAKLSGEIQTREEALKYVERLLEVEGDAGIEPATPSSGGLCSIR